MVVKAKRIRQIFTTYRPISLPRAPWNARVVMATPVLSEVQAPVITRVRPVSIQMMMVSIKVPVMDISPCSTGEFVLAEAAAIGAEPRPASFEKIPLATPFCIAIMMVAPAKPPMA